MTYIEITYSACIYCGKPVIIPNQKYCMCCAIKPKLRNKTRQKEMKVSNTELYLRYKYIDEAMTL